MADTLCVYTYGNKDYFSITELSKFYYKENFPLTNSRIYSSDEIVNSAVNKIKDNVISIEKARELSRLALTDFISQKNPNLMSYLNLDLERFAPQYDSEERKLDFIRKQLIKDGAKKAEVENKELQELLSMEGAEDYLKDIELTMNSEIKANILISYLKDALKLAVLNGGEMDYSEHEISNGVDRAIREGILNEVDRKKMNVKLNNIVSDIYKIIRTHGTPLVDIMLTTEPGVKQDVIGHFDVIVVSDDGNTHVYSIKTSKSDNYEDWDTAKKLNIDYQLAFQRALLGQYINIGPGTSLNVIPISLGNFEEGILNPNNFGLMPVETRTGDPKIGLQYKTGKLFTIASQIIPYTAQMDTDDERRTNIFKDLNYLFPAYEIKTSSWKWNRERIVESIMKYGYFTDKSNAQDYAKEPNIDKTVIEFKENRIYLKDNLNFTAEELRAKAEKIADDYLRFTEGINNKNVVSLKNAIVNAINKGDAKMLNLYNDEQAEHAQKVLVQYLNGNYRVLDSVEEANDLGLIIVQNKRTGDIIVINVSAYNFLSKYDKQYYYKDIEYFKIFTVLNHLYDTLHLDVNKLQEILIFDVDNKTSPPGDVSDMFKKYEEYISSKAYSDKMKLTQERFLSFGESTSKILEGLYITYNESDKQEVQDIFKGIEQRLDKVSVEELVTVISKFEQRYKGLTNKTFESKLDFTKPEEYLYALLKTLLLSKYGLVPEGDAVSLRNYALKYQDFFGIISALYNTELKEYNKHEEAIMGLVGGLSMVTPDRVPSKDLFNINQIIATTIGLIRQEVNKKSSEVKLATRTLYNEIGFTGAKRHIVGDYREPFKDMWLQEGDKVSSVWKTKNPWSQDQVNALSEPKRNYLKKILFHINRQYLRLNDEEFNKIDFSTLESIKRTASESVSKKILQRIDTGEFFRMPLIRSQSWTRHKKLFQLGKIGKGIKGIAAETRDFIDGRELYADDLAQIQKDTRKYNSMYEIYGRQGEEFITNAVNENGVEAYEIDLDTIAHKIILEKTKKRFVDKVLPTINAYVWWIKLNGGKLNKDVSKELSYIKDRINLGFFDEPLVDSELGDVVTAASVVKSITTPMMLALRPATFMKEVVLGMYRGISITATQFFGKDQFTFKDYMSASKVVWTVDKAMSEEFNQVQAINAFYGFANMDLSSYTKKIQTNRRASMFMGVSPLMYFFNTAPDYFNRLTLWVAKMKHDGSYEAHSQNESGQAIYDAKKDGRFSYYFKNRDKYKNALGNYTAATNDEEFNKQRNLYLLIQSDMNEERRLAGEKEFDENKDIIDKAYTEKERQSYKSFTDSIYGYYDKENSPSWHYNAFGILMLQFMQFWPGKMRTWFGRPVKGHNKVIGHYKQATVRRDGKDIKLWRKVEYNEEGKELSFALVEENTGDPAIEWVGSIHEGIMYSMAKTVNATWRSLAGMTEGKTFGETWNQLNDDDMRMRRVLYGLADGLLMMLFFKLFHMLYRSITEVGDPNEDGTLGEEAKQLGDAVLRKTSMEANLWDNTYGALRSEPAFLSYGMKVLSDVRNVMNGDKTIQQLVGNIGAFETLRDWKE